MAASRELTSLLASAENVATLEGIYKQVLDRILRELAVGVSRPGAARARETLRKIRELARDLDPRFAGKVRKWIEDEAPKAFILGDKAATRELRKQLVVAGETPSLVTAFTAVNQTQLKAIVASMSDKLSDAQRQVLTTAGLVVRRTQLKLQQDAAIREQVTGGIVRGASGREISDDIARTILTGRISPAAAERLRQAGFAGDLELYKELVNGPMIQVGQRRMGVRAYANLTARTMQRDAHSLATIVRLQQNEIWHVRVSRHVQTVADVCTPYAGNVFYIGAGVDPAGFPSIATIPNGRPPWHPNCRHILEPWPIRVKNEAQIKRAKETVDLLDEKFFGKSVKEAQKLVESLTEAQLNEAAPLGAGDLQKEPPA